MPIYGTATFINNSVNSGEVDTGLFQGTSINDGEVTDATFQDSSTNTGHVTDTVSFEGDSIDEGSVDSATQYERDGEIVDAPSPQTIEEWLAAHPIPTGNEPQDENDVAPGREVDTNQNATILELLPSIAGGDDIYPETAGDNWSVPGDDFICWDDVDPFNRPPDTDEGSDEIHQIASEILNTDSYSLQLAPVCSDFLFSKYSGVCSGRTTDKYYLYTDYLYSSHPTPLSAIPFPGIQIGTPESYDAGDGETGYYYPKGYYVPNPENCITLDVDTGVCKDIDNEKMEKFIKVWEAFCNNTPLTTIDASYKDIYVKDCINPSTLFVRHGEDYKRAGFRPINYYWTPEYVANGGDPHEDSDPFTMTSSSASVGQDIGLGRTYYKTIDSKYYIDIFSILFTLYSQEDADTIGCGNYVVSEGLNQVSLTNGITFYKASKYVTGENLDQMEVWVTRGGCNFVYDYQGCNTPSDVGDTFLGADGESCCEWDYGVKYSPVTYSMINPPEVYHMLRNSTNVFGKYKYTWKMALQDAYNRVAPHLWGKMCWKANLQPVASTHPKVQSQSFTGHATIFGLNGIGKLDKTDNQLGAFYNPSRPDRIAKGLGYQTGDPKLLGISLNQEAIRMFWGTYNAALMLKVDPHVLVQANGREVVVPLVDAGPAGYEEGSGNTHHGIDLTYATVKHLYPDYNGGGFSKTAGNVIITPTQKGMYLTAEYVYNYFASLGVFGSPQKKLIPKKKKQSRRTMTKVSSVVRAAAGSGADSTDMVSKLETVSKYVKRSGLDYHYKKTPWNLSQVVTVIGYIPSPITRSVKVVQGVTTIVREAYDMVINRSKLPNVKLNLKSVAAQSKRLWVGIINKAINFVVTSDEVRIAETIINGSIKIITRKKSKWGLYQSANYLRRIGMLPAAEPGKDGAPKELKVTGYIGSSY